MPSVQQMPAIDATRATGDAAAVRARHLRRLIRGITLVELALTVMIVAILAVISTTTYKSYKEKSAVNQAMTDIGMIQAAVALYAVDNQGLPDTLAQVSTQIAGMLDPWGNPYQYLNHTDAKGKGKFRKDKNIVPINSDYDLWSNGPDGNSVPPLTAMPSRDDIVRANNGRFIGIASDYDP